MPNLSLEINTIQDQALRANFQKIQDFINGQGTTQNQLQSCEIFVTDNVEGLKIKHSTGGIPLDFILTRLIAPSATKLKVNFADFTKDAISVSITGLTSGQTLSARFLVGTIPNAVVVGSTIRASSEVQEFKSKT